MTKRRLLTARWLLRTPGELREGGGLLLEGARIRAVLDSPQAVRRRATSEGLRIQDLGQAVLTPGLVDAHAHLELSGFVDEVSPAGRFPDWIARLVAARAVASPRELAAAARAGADQLIASGTTTVGDIDSSGAGWSALSAHPIRSVVYREVFDLRQRERREAALEDLSRARPRRRRTLEGLSPHAPYTVGAELFGAMGALARRRDLPTSVHWAETAEEVEWLERGTGPFAAILGDSPRRAGLECIAASGLLEQPRSAALSLVHGNCATPAELERVARAGAVLVHCPGAHRFFGRPPFELTRARRAGVSIALGTDSLASNEALDMTREMALLRAAHPALSPAEVWAMATTEAARALGLAEEVGKLQPGALADLCEWRGEWRRPALILEELTAGCPVPARVWIGGRTARPAR